MSPVAWYRRWIQQKYWHVIDVLSESMDETIYIQDIDQTHRLPGKNPNGKSRPVIVKFVCYNTRNLISKN